MSTQMTTLAALRQPEEKPQGTEMVAMGFTTAGGLALMQRGANLLASSSLVPAQYQGNLANCAIALNMSARMGADPLMVMQNLYIVHGRPGWSSQFLIATWNQCGRFTSLRYEFVGKPGTDEHGCRAWAIEKDTGEKLIGPLVTIALAKAEGWYQKNGSKWKTMPDLMLTYRAASWMVRTYAPELAMGLQTREELQDVIEMEPDADGVLSMRADQLADVSTIQGAGQGPAPQQQRQPVPETPPEVEHPLGPVDQSPSDDAAPWTEEAPEEAPAPPPRAAAAKPRGIAVTYAMVRTAIERSPNLEALEIAGELIESVKTEQRAELREALQQRRAVLAQRAKQAVSDDELPL